MAGNELISLLLSRIKSAVVYVEAKLAMVSTAMLFCGEKKENRKRM